MRSKTLLLLLAWADSHTGDPQAARPGPAQSGPARLVHIGGEGTPAGVDLCLA